MLAEHSTGAQLDRIVAAYRRGIDLEQERRGVRDRQAGTSAMFFWDDDGSGVLTVRLAPEDAKVVKAAWDAARDEVSPGDGSAEPPEPGPLGARAVVAMAESYLANGPAARKDRYLAMIHVDEQVLSDDTDARCELDDGPALSPDTRGGSRVTHRSSRCWSTAWVSRSRWARRPRRSPPG